MGDWIIQDFKIISGDQYELILNPFFDYYSLVYLSLFIFLLYKLIRSLKKSDGVKRSQLLYVLFGALGFGGISMIVSFILPLFNISLVAPIDAQSSLIFVGFTAYAIVRHQLLEIRLVVTRSIIYFFLILFVAGTFTGLTLLVGSFFQTVTGANQFITTGIVSIIIVIGFEPLKRWISNTTDNVFYKAKIDYQELLQEVSQVINREISLNQLVNSVNNLLKERLKVNFVAIAISDDQGNFKEYGDYGSHEPKTLPSGSSVIRHLKHKGHISILESLERKIQDTSDEEKLKGLNRSRQEMEDLHAALIGPINAQGKFNAVLIIGPKLSGDSFSTEELRIFNTLTPQIGAAIEKSMLYEEVKTFSSQLKAKIQEATVELKERNRSLIALQRVTTLITRSLDYKNVLQGIADSIASELGYIGGVVMLKEPSTDRTYFGAVTRTKLTEKALKLVPGALDKMEGNINDPDLASKAMRNGKLQVSEQLEEFLTPPLPKLVSKGIQKLVRAKTIVAEPVYSENVVIGALVYLIERPKDLVKHREYELMRSIADQTGITIRTLRYIDEVQVINRDLEEANVHLRQLDQAKSEFVSIASHQLRTPMTGIMGYLSMMVQGDFGKMKPEHTKLLDNLLSESQRMIRLINLFLNVSKIESGKLSLSKQPTKITDLIEQQIKDQIKPAETKGLVLKYQKPKALPAIDMDADKMSNVIQNLIDNAIKYTERGQITIRAFQTDGQVQVEVKDTGVGIKKEVAPELFKKFVRGSGIAQINPDGSGLGLFIAKSIVEMHGGKIWASSEGENKGSTFAFTIPIKNVKTNNGNNGQTKKTK
ncbi:MAG: ATP-binding protein [bacterium]